MKTKLSFIFLVSSVMLFGTEFKLTEQGKPVCTIVINPQAGPVEERAASELALFLGKISGGDKPVIATAPEKGKYPVILEISKDKRLQEDGFMLDAGKDSLHISGNNPNGILYGAYEVLKKYGGIRWLVPGQDGEYFNVKPTISVSEGITVKNPDFKQRNISAVCMGWNSPVWDTWDWGVRNNMHFGMHEGIIRCKDLEKGLMERGVSSHIGGHCFTDLLTGWALDKRTPAEHRAYTEKLFAEHPEYFPLINSKRIISYDGGSSTQPCTTNPEVINIVAGNIVRWYKSSHKPVSFEFGNNDGTQWCQCPKCLEVDPPGEKAKSVVSTRYWTFANAVLEQVKKECPELDFSGWSYQNYSDAPIGIQPDKRIAGVMISNHRRCWKHALNDPNCPTNPWYYNYNKTWNAKNVPLFTYEELSYAGYAFLPNEKNWVDTLKYYKKEMPNFIGMKTEVCCPDGRYRKLYDKPQIRNNWYMMWQAMYLGMYFHWNVNADFDELYEEINSLYYGKGWAGGMREFRKLLTKLYMDASGCWGYGHSTPVGKFLDVPGTQEKLLKYLDAAEKAAAADPDKRALAHVMRDRKFFEETWIKAYKDYITNFREIKVYPLQGKIAIDGKLNEPDWKNADVITRFKKTRAAESAEHQTAVKLAYDADNIYVGIECLEPKPDKLKTTVKEHDGPVWEDNDIELFLNDPILGGAYFQIMINAAGVICDGSVSPGQKGVTRSFESNAEIKTSFAKDRWFMEIRLPVKPLTGGRLSAGNVLKMNVMRCRVIEGKPEESETSTWSSGTPHSVEVFHPITFASPRSVTAGNRSEVDTRLWKNGSFNEIDPNTKRIPKHWTVPNGRIPKFWSLSGAGQYGGDLEMILHPDSGDNYFVRLRKGFIFQDYGFKNDRLGVGFRVRGEGKLRFMMLRYKADYKGSLPSCIVKEIDINSKEWKHESFEFARPSEDKAEIHALALWPQSGEIDIDDMFLVGK